MTRRLVLTLALSPAAAVLLSGCGGTASVSTYSPAAVTALSRDLRGVDTAMQAHDMAGARASLAALATDAAAAQRLGQITPARASSIVSAEKALVADLTPATPSATPQATLQPTPTPTTKPTAVTSPVAAVTTSPSAAATSKAEPAPPTKGHGNKGKGKGPHPKG